MTDQSDRLTYDDVMLDWAVAELLSPRLVNLWQGAACDALRAKVSNGGIGSLTPYERSWLIGAICEKRAGIVLFYGPCRSWTFWPQAIPREELERFSILHHFGHPSFSFRDHAAEIDPGTSKPRDLGASVMEVVTMRLAGEAPLGTPIAVVRRAPMLPVLIEGYTRCMAALRMGQPSIDLFLASPEPATAAIGSDAR